MSALGDEEKKVEIRHGGGGIWWCAWTLWAKFRRIGGVHVTWLPYLWFLPLQTCLDLGGPQTSAERMTKHPSGAADFLFRKRSRICPVSKNWASMTASSRHTVLDSLLSCVAEEQVP